MCGSGWEEGRVSQEVADYVLVVSVLGKYSVFGLELWDIGVG